MYAVGAALKKEMAARASEIALRGAGGEPVDLRRTIASHGVADLPPNRIDEEAWTLELTLPLGGKQPTTVLVSEGRKGYAKIQVLSGGADRARLRTAVGARPSTRRGPQPLLRSRRRQIPTSPG